MAHSFYPVRLIPQTYPLGCWSACIAMIFDRDMSAGPGEAELSDEGGIHMRPENVQRLARSWGLNMLSFCTLSDSAFEDLMERRGPLMICGGMNFEGGEIYPHAVVAFAYDGRGVHLHDPEPVNQGTTRVMTWRTFMTRFPLGAIYFLSRR